MALQQKKGGREAAPLPSPGGKKMVTLRQKEHRTQQTNFWPSIFIVYLFVLPWVEDHGEPAVDLIAPAVVGLVTKSGAVLPGLPVLLRDIDPRPSLETIQKWHP